MTTASAEELLKLADSVRDAIENASMVRVAQERVLREIDTLRAALQARIAAGG